MSLVINPDSFEFEYDMEPFGQCGKVEASINGEMRRLRCLKNEWGIHLHRIYGRVENGRKWWELRPSLRPDGNLDFAVREGSTRRFEGKTWGELAFSHP
jgi:hypothetical protein